MNEEALQYSYDLFKQDGYNGSVEEYKKLISEDKEALNYSFSLFSNDGYSGELEEFNALVTEDPIKTEAVATETASVTAVDEAVDTDLPLVDGSLESQLINKEEYNDPIDLSIELTSEEKKNLPYAVSQQMSRENNFTKKRLTELTAQTKEEKERAEMSFVDKLAIDLQKGSSTLGEMMASIPETIYNIAASPQNFIALIPGLEGLGTTSEKFKDNFDIENPILNFYEEESERLGKVQDIYNDKNYDYVGIGKNFEEGNYLDGFKQMASGITESAPVSISMMVGGAAMSSGKVLGVAANAGKEAAKLAAVSTVVMAGPEIQEQITSNPGQSEFASIAKGLGIAGAESVFSSIGSGTLGKVYKDILTKEGKEVGVKVFQKGLIEMYQTVLKKAGAPAAMIGNGVEEVATTITQNMIKGLDPFVGVTDSFLTGVGSGGVYGAPVNVAQANSAVKSGLVSLKINRELKNSDSNDIVKAFSADSDLTEAEANIALIPGADKALKNKIDLEIKNNRLTEEQGDDIKKNFIQVQGALNSIQTLNLGKTDQALTAKLLIQKNKLQTEIDQVGDKNLTIPQAAKIDEINLSLQDVSARTVTKEVDKIKGLAKNIENLDIKEFETTEEVEKFLLNRDKPEDQTESQFKSKAKEGSSNQGFIVQNNDGSQSIVINRAVSNKEFAITAPRHEFLHALLFKTVKESPETQIQLGNALKGYIEGLDPSKVKDSNFAKRLDQYSNDPANVRAEETLTLFSEAVQTGDIKFDENLFTKIGDTIRRILQSAGLSKVKFNNGKDVYNFIKDYNNSLDKGSLNESQVSASRGVKGDLVSATKSDTSSVIKESKQLTPEQDKSIATEVTDLQAIRKENKDLAAKYGKEPIKGGKETRLENKILESIDPIIGRVVTDRTKALYDPIADDAKKTVSRQNFQESMRSDIQTMVFDEFNGKQDLEKFIVNRAFLRANNLAKRLGIQSVEEGITKGLEAAEKIAIDETVATVDKDVKLTKATKILSNDQLNRAKESIAKMNIDPSQISYKKLGNVTADITAELVGIPADKITSKTKNLSKPETTTAAMFIEKNVDYIRRTLPEGAVLEAATEKLIGTSTGVPKAMLNAFYAKGKRLSKGAGLIPWNKNKGITNNDILEAIGRPKGEKPSPIDPRSPKGQMIKGIISIVDKNITNELVRTEKDLTIEQEVDAGAGRSALMFARATGIDVIEQTNQFIENQEFVKTSDELAADNKMWRYIAKKLEVDVLSSKNPKDVKEYREWIKTIAKKLPKEFFTQGTFANAGISAADRNFYFTSKADLESVLDGLEFAESDADITEAVRRQTYVTGGANGKISTTFLKDFNTKEYKAKQKSKLKGLEKVFKVFEAEMKADKNNVKFIIAMLSATSQGMGHFVRTSAPVKFYAKNVSSGIVEEHTMPASLVAKYLFTAAVKGSVSKDFVNIEKNYFQGALPKVDDKKLKGKKLNGKPFNYTAMTPEGWKITDNIWARYFNINVGNNNGGIDPTNIVISNGKTIQEEFGINEMGFKVTPELIKSKVTASKSNNVDLPSSIQYSKNITIQEGIDALAKTDKALDNARRLNAPVKKIRVFDFDDTLAQTKSNVLYTMPDGTKGKIDAATFAKEAGNMEAEGAVWDFSEFSKVMQGTKGPLLEVAKIIADKRGTDDVFVLTARPANAAGPIKEFLASMGLDIPLKNITGLGDGAPQAKAGWIMGKAAEGYNDFYFADDHTGNVKAVKDVLSLLDVKSKVQLAKIQFSKNIDKEFNSIIENKTGIAADKNYASVKAALVGRKKGRFDFFIPPSAEDFLGLLYKTLGKGKTGDAQLEWYKKHLLNPYARAMESISRDRNALSRNFRALKKELKVIPKDLKKKVKDSEFTREQAVRVYIWDQVGKDVPGLSKSDLKELVDMVKSDANLELFAQEVMKLNKGRAYTSPKEGWVSGTITTDLLESLNTTGRKQYLELWQQNVDTIFSEKNLNKMEAAYGKSYRLAMENILGRMKTGRNRSYGTDNLTGRLTDWLTGSIGAIMFFNTRSAVLQTLSAVNFINFGDNNIFAAGKAFANQKQYWSDFSKLWSSDFLIERRDGLKINVNEADIADIAKENGIRGVINKLLKLGFTPTQVADSFAIASGGATFYRNRVKSLTKEGMDITAAEGQAMRDFRETAEESQQSSRPDKISQQQAGPLGRVVLAFANTPAQYARLIKKSASDLKNGRGDAKTNLSKILYYGIAQNLLFNAAQQALFAIAFDEEEEVDKKQVSILNGMVDSVVRGTGMGGAIFTVVKNASMRLFRENEKKNPKYEEAALELLKISPPISSKVQKLRSAGRTASWNMKDIKNKGFSLDNPAYLAGGNVVSAATNVPLDRVIKKLNNVVASGQDDIALYKRIALLAGWSEWELGLSKGKTKKSTKPTGNRKVRTRRTRTRRE